MLNPSTRPLSLDELYGIPTEQIVADKGICLSGTVPAPRMKKPASLLPLVVILVVATGISIALIVSYEAGWKEGKKQKPEE